MKISVDDKELFTLSDVQIKVIQNDVSSDIFDADMKRRLQWVLTHKYDECFKVLKSEWESKLALVLDSIPTNPDKLAELIFAQPDYRCRKQRDEESTSLK